MAFSLEEFIHIIWSLNIGFLGQRNKSITCPVIHKNVLLPRHSSVFSSTANRLLFLWHQTTQAAIHHPIILNLNFFGLLLSLFWQDEVDSLVANLKDLVLCNLLKAIVNPVSDKIELFSHKRSKSSL